ncbi:DUF1761 domain-containing protein [Candidatus Uhrbacteria bacterium]|nr:MAG: DUF1761 domain-containing protein [Candidatus Uhrbacteria bacterium]
MTFTPNYLAILVAAISTVVLGFLWYGPLFGKPWMKLMGIDPSKMSKEAMKGMNKTYALMSIGSLVLAYVLSFTTEFAMTYTQTFGWVGGVMSGFWTWLGFFAPVQMDEQLWGNKPWKLYFINTGYRLVSLIIMGVILAVWR